MTIENCCANRILFHELARSLDDSSAMTKRYVAYSVRKKDRAGNIVRGFVLGLAEFGCFGTRLFDLSGYPHDSEADAIYSDWQAVGNDMWKAIDDSQPEQADDRQGRPSTGPKDRKQEKWSSEGD